MLRFASLAVLSVVLALPTVARGQYCPVAGQQVQMQVVAPQVQLQTVYVPQVQAQVVQRQVQVYQPQVVQQLVTQYVPQVQAQVIQRQVVAQQVYAAPVVQAQVIQQQVGYSSAQVIARQRVPRRQVTIQRQVTRTRNGLFGF